MKAALELGGCCPEMNFEAIRYVMIFRLFEDWRT